MTLTRRAIEFDMRQQSMRPEIKDQSPATCLKARAKAQSKSKRQKQKAKAHRLKPVLLEPSQ